MEQRHRALERSHAATAIGIGPTSFVARRSRNRRPGHRSHNMEDCTCCHHLDHIPGRQKDARSGGCQARPSQPPRRESKDSGAAHDHCGVARTQIGRRATLAGLAAGRMDHSAGRSRHAARTGQGTRERWNGIPRSPHAHSMEYAGQHGHIEEHAGRQRITGKTGTAPGGAAEWQGGGEQQ